MTKFWASVLRLFLIWMFLMPVNTGWAYGNFSSLKQEEKIKKLRGELLLCDGVKYFFKSYQLARVHKKLLKNDYSTIREWDFIEDDIRFGSGGYAVSLLKRMNNDSAKEKLFEMHQLPKFFRKQIRVKDPRKSFWSNILTNKKYAFSESSLLTLQKDVEDSTQSVSNTDENSSYEDVDNLEDEDSSVLSDKNYGISSSDTESRSRSQDADSFLGQTKEVQKGSTINSLEVEEKFSEEKSYERKLTTDELIDNAVESESSSVTTDLSEEEAIKEIDRGAKVDSSIIREKELSEESQSFQENFKEKMEMIEEFKKDIFEPKNTYFWQVVKTTGDVQIKRKDKAEFTELDGGEKLFEGDTLTTGAKSSVMLLIKGLDNEDSYSQLFENSELKVLKLTQDNFDQLDEVYIDLILGEVLVNVENLPQTSNFRVKTPTSVAGIRGTMFNVHVLYNMVKFLVVRGKIAVRDLDIARAVTQYIGAGQQTRKFHGRQVLPPKSISPGEFSQYKDMAGEVSRFLSGASGSTKNQRFRLSKFFSGERDDSSFPSEGLKSKKQLKKYLRNDSDIRLFTNPNDETSPLSRLLNKTRDPFTGEAIERFLETVPLLVDPKITLEELRRRREEVVEEVIPEIPTDVSFFVNNMTGNNSNSGEIGSPFRTITHAISQADGVTPTAIIVRDTGVDYTIASGESFPLVLKNFIAIKGVGGTPHIANDSSVDPVLSATGLFNVSYRDMALTNNLGIGFLSDNSNLKIVSSQISADVAFELINGGQLETKNSNLSGCNQFVVDTDGVPYRDDGSTFNNNGTIIRNMTGSAPSIEMLGSTVSNCADAIVESTMNASGGGVNMVFDDCTFDNNNNLGIQALGSNNIVMIIKACRFINHNSGGMNLIHKFTSGFDGGLDLMNNRFQNNTNVGFLALAGGQHIRMYNNLSTNNTAGFYHYQFLDSSTIRILNNTLHTVNTSQAGILLDQCGIGIDPSTAKVYNNIFDGFDNTAVITRDTNVAAVYSFRNNVFNVAGSEVEEEFGCSSPLSIDVTTLNSGAHPNSSGNISAVPIYDGSFVPVAAGNLEDAGTGVGGEPGFPNADVLGNSRVTNSGGSKNIDIGAIERAGIDPLISGRVYDAATGRGVDNAVVGLYTGDASKAINASEGESFRFNVFPGTYRLAVTGSGIFFPSKRASIESPGDHGGVFTLGDNQDIEVNIPVDVTGYLSLEKDTNKRSITPGEVLTVHFKIKNEYWFETVEDIVVWDKVPSGFKYVPNSVRLNGVAYTDASYQDGYYTIPLGALRAQQEANITYQIVASTGIGVGSYKMPSICKNTGGDEISNQVESSIIVELDPLFTAGTLLGRVYIDENENGLFDFGENSPGVVEVATEYGAVIKTDENGMFHLKDVFPGRHTLQIDPLTIPDGYISAKKHGFPFEMFEGSITNVDLGIVKSEISPPNFLFVSLGEITLKQNEFSGNIETIEKNDDFDDGFDVEGRGAFFLKGKVLGKYLVNVSYDSERLSREQKYLRRGVLKRNLDPDKYYPVYGDGSSTDYTATETQDALFLMIEWDESFVSWGSAEVDWSLYRRVFHGGHALFQSLAKTKFQDTKTSVEGFYATADYLTAHEEFIGTGNSLYHLEHSPVVEGSEKVVVQFKNRFSDKVLQERILVEQVDYTIDYDNGRILLKRPLSSTIRGLGNQIISNDLFSGTQAVLSVDYEYETFSALDRSAYGGKVSKFIGDHVQLEASYAEEDRDSDPYKLTSVATRLQINSDSYIRVSYQESEETYSGGGVSYDGGFSFSSQDDSLKNGQDGSMWDVSGKYSFEDKANFEFSYAEQDAGYSSIGTFSSLDNISYEASIDYSFNDEWSLEWNHLGSEIESADSVAQDQKVVDSLDKSSLGLNWKGEVYDLRIEYVFQDIGNPFEGTEFLGNFSPRGRQLAAIKAGRKFLDNYYVYLIAQGTIEADDQQDKDNDMLTLGARVPLFEKMDVQVEGRLATFGESIDIHLILNENADEQSHIGFETGTQDDQGKFQSVSFARTVVDEKGYQYKFIKDYSYFDQKVLNGDIFDLSIPVNDRFSIGFNYETSSLEQKEFLNGIEREATSFRYNYLVPGLFRLYGKAEFREDRDIESEVSTDYYFFQDKIHIELNDALNIKISGEVGVAENKDSDVKKMDLLDIGGGFSWRTIEKSSLTILGKVNYVEDLPLERNSTFYETSEQKKMVYSLQGILDFHEKWQLISKFAFRDLEEKVGNRDWLSSQTYLAIAGLNYQILSDWHIGGEYRLFKNKTFKDEKTGFLLQVSKEISDWLLLTVGYNFTEFDDDLKNRDSYDQTGGFFRIVSRY